VQHQRIISKTRKASFRYASPPDATELMFLYVELYNEARITEFELDTGQAYLSLFHALASGDRPHLLAVIDGKPVGFIAWTVDLTFSKRPIVAMREFFVIRKHRRGALGKYLLKLMLLELKHIDACLFQAALAPRIPDCAGSVRNLFLKEGMREVGVVMQKILT